MKIQTNNYELNTTNNQKSIQIKCSNFTASFQVMEDQDGKPYIDFAVLCPEDGPMIIENQKLAPAAKVTFRSVKSHIPNSKCTKLSAINDCILVDEKFINKIYTSLSEKGMTMAEFAEHVPCHISSLYRYIKFKKFTTKVYKAIVTKIPELKVYPVDYVHMA